ncbi:MAG: alpha/beta hydrolase [Planctomycetales bacterium]|nr:alpha/beta hydrolase [Planctomycetales bacterium]
MTVIIGLMLVSQDAEHSLAANRQQAITTTEEIVAFQSDAVTLSGTLVMPTSAGPHPAVIIVHGARPNERGPYRRFATEIFAQQGIAALIYDKRGYGQSSGDAVTTSLYGLAEDVSAGVHYLQKRSDIDPTCIGLQGDSQAGWIMPIAAAGTSDISFVIMVAASAVSPAQQEVFSIQNKLRSMGLSERIVDAGRKARKLMDDYAYAVNQKCLPAIDALQEVIALRTDHNPVPLLEQLSQPALIILGEADPFVPTEYSALLFDTSLRKAGNRDYTIIVYPEANHGIQVPKTNAQGETTLTYVAGYHDTMINWVVAHVSEDAPPGNGVQGTTTDESAAFSQSGIYGKLPWYGTATIQLMLIAIFALVFGSAVPGLALGLRGARQTLGNQTPPTLTAARRAHRVGVASSALNLIVLAGVVILIAVLLLSDDDMVIPTLFQVLRLLSLIACLLAIIMGGFALLAWKRSYWSLAGRVYYSMIAVAALLFVPFLSYWNMFGF